MKIFFVTVFALLMLLPYLRSQERGVRVDFESSSFYNNPNVPFDEPFVIMGEVGREVETVKALIYYSGKRDMLHSYVWNRNDINLTETFSIVIPPVLRSNTKYDFEIITYKLLSKAQKEDLLRSAADRIRFLIMNNIYFDGKNVVINKPKDVYNKLSQLIDESFKYYESKNLICVQAPSLLVMNELKKQNGFKFGKFVKRSDHLERDAIANKLINDKVEHLVSLICSELIPFINSQLVQHHRQANIKAVETDKVAFTLPVNIGMYGWNKTVSDNNSSVEYKDFTPGVGVTLPFNNKGRSALTRQVIDSFGFSCGVLLKSIKDNNGTEFVTPGINMPLYTGLGFRVFKVIRFNAGILVLSEKKDQNFNDLTIIPTAGLALELNLWMGIKK